MCDPIFRRHFGAEKTAAVHGFDQFKCEPADQRALAALGPCETGNRREDVLAVFTTDKPTDPDSVMRMIL